MGQDKVEFIRRINRKEREAFRELLQLYFTIGAKIIEKQEKQGWGAQVIF